MIDFYRSDRAEQCEGRPGASSPRKGVVSADAKRRRGRPSKEDLERRAANRDEPSELEVRQFKEAISNYQASTGDLFLSPKRHLWILRKLGYRK